MIDELLKFFVLFFVVVEPVTLVPLFAAMTEGADETFRRRMALKAVMHRRHRAVPLSPWAAPGSCA